MDNRSGEFSKRVQAYPVATYWQSGEQHHDDTASVDDTVRWNGQIDHATCLSDQPYLDEVMNVDQEIFLERYDPLV